MEFRFCLVFKSDCDVVVIHKTQDLIRKTSLRTANTFLLIRFEKNLREIKCQRTNGPVIAHLISGLTISTKTNFYKFDIVLKLVKELG